MVRAPRVYRVVAERLIFRFTSVLLTYRHLLTQP
jgi:hypothetical protein